MGKIKVTADSLIELIKTIFSDEDVNQTIVDGNPDWKGKTITDVLNVDYYALKHRELNNQINFDDRLDFLKTSYCLVSIDSLQRLFSKDIDQLTVDATLQYWIQTEKIQLLVDLIESANIATSGIRIPIQIDGEQRKLIIAFDNLDVSEPEDSEIGEALIATIGVSIVINPDFESYSDYTIEFLIDNEYKELPVSRINIDNTMVPKAIPKMNNPYCSDTLNLSNATCITLEYRAEATNEVAKMFKRDSLKKAAINFADKPKNNKVYTMKLKCDGDGEYIYNLKIQSHKIQFNNASIDDSGAVLVLVTGEEE